MIKKCRKKQADFSPEIFLSTAAGTHSMTMSECCTQAWRKKHTLYTWGDYRTKKIPVQHGYVHPLQPDLPVYVLYMLATIRHLQPTRRDKRKEKKSAWAFFALDTHQVVHYLDIYPGHLSVLYRFTIFHLLYIVWFMNPRLLPTKREHKTTKVLQKYM